MCLNLEVTLVSDVELSKLFYSVKVVLVSCRLILIMPQHHTKTLSV